MLQAVTRRRFVFRTLGVIGGTMVAGDLLPLLAEAAKRKQVLRVANAAASRHPWVVRAST